MPNITPKSYVEFPPSPLSFGHLHVNPEDCAVIELPVGKLRIITPTQSVMDWFVNEGESDDEWRRFKDAVGVRKLLN